MKKYIIVLLLSTFVFNTNTTSAQVKGNGKKVYADYHGTRYTREHDGMLGRWSFYGDTEKSLTPIKRLSYNADIILENGKNDIAAVAFPMAGMQSAIDPEFIEYQILSAKAAKIDGFFIEWGFPEHESTILLEAMQKEASKYNFEIGVNWCDGWLYYDWITKQRPEIKTRFDKTQHFKTSFQYLIDNVFSSSTSPKVNNTPVFYLFGGGITSTEYKSVINESEFNLPAGTKFPEVLKRIIAWGEIVDNKYIPADIDKEMREWEKLNMSPTPWIPARARNIDNKFPLWDQYATKEDVIKYMEPFKEKVWEKNYPNPIIKSGFVTPGMDNHGCGGWGRGHFFCIPREEGSTYEEMWKFNMSAKEKLDMVFIASWSDYTEGHEIEPTIENGYRELKTTLKYAAEFKEELIDENGLELPLRLFHLRKKSAFLESLGFNNKKLNSTLNNIGLLISNQDYSKAIRLLNKNEKAVDSIEKRLTISKFAIDNSILINGKEQNGIYNVEDKLHLNIGKQLVEKLQNQTYTGYITFNYLDEGVNKFEIISKTKREPKSLFSTVADIRTNRSEKWKKAIVKLIDSNIDLNAFFPYNSSFIFIGKGKVKDIKLEFEIYKK